MNDNKSNTIFGDFFAVNVFAECPEGTWPRNLYSGPGGGFYEGLGGGMYEGHQEYCSNIPPWPVFIQYLEENGYEEEAKFLREELYK